MRKRSYIWWNVAGLVLFVAGFLLGWIDMETRRMQSSGEMSMNGGNAMQMSGGGIAMVIGGILQMIGGPVAVIAFALEMRRRFRVKRQERQLSTH